MHVLFIAGWWPSREEPLNGVFIKEHAQAIALHTKVTVVNLHSLQKSNSWLHFPSLIQKHETTIHPNLTTLIYSCSFKIRRFGVIEYELIKTIRNLINAQTIPITHIHLNVLNSFLPHLILTNSSVFKLPIILTEHSSFYHTEIYDLPTVQIAQKKIELSRLLNNSYLKFILPVSVELGKVMADDFNVPSHKFIPIPNVANTVFTTANIAPFLNHKGQLILFCAALWNTPKNPVLFLQALLLLKQRNIGLYNLIYINWAGNGSQMQEILTYVHANLTDLKIKFLGILSKQQISHQMQHANYLIHPTDAENLPCIIIESLCVGLPVLSARVNGVIELIDDSNGTMYEAKNVEDFYLKLVTLLNHNIAFNKVAIATNARQKYRGDAVGKQILDVYNLILSK